MKYNRETQKYLNKVSTMDIAYIVGIAFEWFFNGLTVIEVGSAIVALASFIAIKKVLFFNRTFGGATQIWTGGQGVAGLNPLSPKSLF